MLLRPALHNQPSSDMLLTLPLVLFTPLPTTPQSVSASMRMVVLATPVPLPTSVSCVETPATVHSSAQQSDPVCWVVTPL